MSKHTFFSFSYKYWLSGPAALPGLSFESCFATPLTVMVMSGIRNLGSCIFWGGPAQQDRWRNLRSTSFCEYRLKLVISRHTISGGVLCYALRTLSVRLSVVRLSVSTSFPCSNFSTFWPIFFKLCIDIGIGEEWYRVASGLISFWNNRVLALDVCQKCFALRFRALTVVPFYRFSSNFA